MDALCSTTSSAGSAAERARRRVPGLEGVADLGRAARPRRLAAAYAHADELRLFDEGTHALAAGDARAAEKAWRAGYEIAHDPAFLVHLGEAEEKAGQTAEAIDSYRRYLREAPDASDRADIEQRLARLAPAAPAPAPAPKVETPGEFVSTPVPTAAAPGAPGPTAAHVDAEGPVSKDQEDSGWNRYNATAVIASGVTLALLGTAAFYGAEASSKEGDVNRLLTYRFPPPQYSSVAATYTKDVADGKSDAHTSRILLLAAAGTGLVAAVFFVLDAVRTPAETAPAAPALPAVSVSIAPAASGFGAQGAWSWRF